jgi:hypothetical protein
MASVVGRSAFRAVVADYEEASTNTIDHCITPYAALRQKETSAITSGVVPGMMEIAFRHHPLNVWDNFLVSTKLSSL